MAIRLPYLIIHSFLKDFSMKQSKTNNQKQTIKNKMIFLFVLMAIISCFQPVKASYEPPTDSLDIFNIGQNGWDYTSDCSSSTLDDRGWYDKFYTQYDTNGIGINFDYLHTTIRYDDIGHMKVYFRFKRVETSYGDFANPLENQPEPNLLNYFILIDVWKISYLPTNPNDLPSTFPNVQYMIKSFKKEIMQNMKYYFHVFSQDPSTSYWWEKEIMGGWKKLQDLIGFRFVFPCSFQELIIPNQANTGIYSVNYETCNGIGIGYCCRYDYLFKTLKAGNADFTCPNHMICVDREHYECNSNSSLYSTCLDFCYDSLLVFDGMGPYFTGGTVVIKDYRSMKDWCNRCTTAIYYPKQNLLINEIPKYCSIIKVYDILGNLLNELNCLKSDCEIINQYLNTGIYIIQYLDDQGMIISTKTKYVE